MHERSSDSGNSDPQPLNFIELKDRLFPRLAGYSGNADAKEAAGLLLELTEHRLTFKGCIERVRSGIAKTAKDQAQAVKGQFSTQVHGSYPAGSEDAPGVMSPKRFIRENDLDGRIRPELREAQAGAIKTSRDGLVSAIEKDDISEKATPDITDAEIEADIIEEVNARMNTLLERTTEVVELMPAVEIPLNRLGSHALRMMHYQNPIAVKSIALPASRRERAQLDGAIYAIKTILGELLDSEKTVARAITCRYEEQIREHVSSVLIGRYEELESVALAALPAQVEAAYAEAAHLGPQYEPQAKPDELDEPDDEPAGGVDDELPAEAEAKETIHLGEIDSPFPWAPSKKTHIFLIRKGGSSMLFCEGMSDAADAISDQLRVQSENREDFDRSWEFVKEAEINGIGLNHGNINRVKDQSAAAYDGVSVLYYGSPGRNARRIYYVKVPVSKYPPIGKLAEQAGLDADTPILVLVAETDKAKQLKILHELGIPRRLGTEYGAGSI